MDAHVVMTFVRLLSARRGGQICSTLKAMVYHGKWYACAHVRLSARGFDDCAAQTQALPPSPALMKTAAACRMAHSLRGRIGRAPYSSSQQQQQQVVSSSHVSFVVVYLVYVRPGYLRPRPWSGLMMWRFSSARMLSLYRRAQYETNCP
jgi:hypothetical protein